jgi:hypothetical protein
MPQLLVTGDHTLRSLMTTAVRMTPSAIEIFVNTLAREMLTVSPPKGGSVWIFKRA